MTEDHFREAGKKGVPLQFEIITHKKQRSIMKEFEIRQYGRTELAQLYNPDITPASAWKRLRLWIGRFPGLTQQLETLGYQQRQRVFTPAQVRAIADAIGEP